MKTKYIILLLIIFILFVSVFNEYNSQYNSQYNNQDNNQDNKNTEGFTPSLRKIYRPHIRKTRIAIESFYNKHSNKLHNIARKIGIM